MYLAEFIKGYRYSSVCICLNIEFANILWYNSLADELSTKSAINKWADKKNIFLPRVNGDELEVLPYDATTIGKGSFNIDEPTGKNVCDITIIDLIIVPAVAYDHNGNRIGRGKGYYDRLLKRTNATKIGIGYDFQLLQNIDAEPHDIPVDIVITPNNFINIK